MYDTFNPTLRKGIILVTQTGIRITPYEKNQNKFFEKSLSIYNKVTHSYDALTGEYIEEDGEDPCYISFRHSPSTLSKAFPGYKFQQIKISTPKLMNENFMLNQDITPTDVQYTLVNKILHSYNKHQWFVYLSQGFGKTMLSVYLMSIYNVKTLIMCYSTDILSQWKSTLDKKTTFDIGRALTLDDSHLLMAIYNGTFDASEYDVFLCTQTILVKFGKKYGYTKLYQLMERLGIGLKIFDEAHRNINAMIKINAYTSIDKTIYLSGDYGQSKPRKEILYKRIFHDVPIIRPDEEIMEELKYTVAIVVSFNSKPTVLEEAGVYTKRGFSFYNYMQYQFKKPIFFNVLDYLLENITKNNTGFKVLILVNLVDHVDELYGQLQQKWGNQYMVGRYHGKVSQEEKDIVRKNATLIVANYQSFSTGIDVSQIKYVISSSVCTKIDDNQASGRARPLPDGSDCYYFMLNDIGFEYCRETIPNRLEYLKITKIKDINHIDYYE